MKGSWNKTFSGHLGIEQNANQWKISSNLELPASTLGADSSLLNTCMISKNWRMINHKPSMSRLKLHSWAYIPSKVK